ncbi:TetR/AcrR family transcriptional regulator [Clostridium oceanicum]
MDSFWDIYCDKKIEKITVKEVTTKAGFNRSTFYEYFLDIYDVLDQIEKELLPDIKALPPIKLANQNFGMPIDSFLKMLEEKEKYYSVLLGEKGDPQFIRKLKDSAKNAIYTTLGSKVDSEELDFVIEYTLSAMIGIMEYWLSKGKNLSNEKLLELTGKLMDNGVSSYLTDNLLYT